MKSIKELTTVFLRRHRGDRIIIAVGLIGYYAIAALALSVGLFIEGARYVARATVVRRAS